MERYNLRSGKRECHIPIQLQLARDEEFLMESLEASGHAGQVFDSDQSDLSRSDIDISALLNTSDQNKVTQPGQVPQGVEEVGGQLTLSLRMISTKLFCHS